MSKIMIKIVNKIYNKFFYYILRIFNYLFFISKKFPNVLDSHQSIEFIIKKKMSVSRFGDGELMIIRGKGWGFQKHDNKLAKRLIEVLNSNNPKIAICIPDVFKDKSRFTDSPKRFWHDQILNNLHYWNKYTLKNKLYLDSLLTRFYMDMKDKESFPKKSIDLFKKIWDNEDLLIIEGVGSRLGFKNDLFDNSKSIKRILCPAENAFSKYDQILELSMEHSKDRLVLVALGMAATVLSYDLASKGFWAIDIGHIDVEYEWYRMKAIYKVPVLHRYMNEVSSREVDVIEDQEYINQIIGRIQ